MSKGNGPQAQARTQIGWLDALLVRCSGRTLVLLFGAVLALQFAIVLRLWIDGQYRSQEVCPPPTLNAYEQPWDRGDLPPLGGWLMKPADWFITHETNQTGYVWYIRPVNQKEHAAVAIQLLCGQQRRTGKTAADAMRNVLQVIARNAHRVLETEPEYDIPGFRGSGIDVEQGTNPVCRIRTRVFWATNCDIAVVSMFAAPLSEWKRQSSSFDRMARFSLGNVTLPVAPAEGLKLAGNP